MESNSQRDESTLFLVRVWVLEMSGGGVGWGGRVQNVVTGEAHTFRDWAELLDWLEEMLSAEVVAEPVERRPTDL